MGKNQIGKRLLENYQRLLNCFGLQYWWPADEPFEVMIGAILTQSAAWTNVEKGILNLKKAGALSPRALRQIPQEELATLIHPCGYFNAKAAKLKALAGWFGERFSDSLEKMFAEDTGSLRRELLGVYGIGEETADSILLYAGSKPVFVIDAYTRRIMDRLGFKPGGDRYADYQKFYGKICLRMRGCYHEITHLVGLGKKPVLKSNPG